MNFICQKCFPVDKLFWCCASRFRHIFDFQFTGRCIKNISFFLWQKVKNRVFWNVFATIVIIRTILASLVNCYLRFGFAGLNFHVLLSISWRIDVCLGHRISHIFNLKELFYINQAFAHII